MEVMVHRPVARERERERERRFVWLAPRGPVASGWRLTDSVWLVTPSEILLSGAPTPKPQQKKEKMHRIAESPDRKIQDVTNKQTPWS
jgi:hypothetical protein